MNKEDDNWFPIDEEREAKKENGVMTIRPITNTVTTPLFCPLCELPMKYFDDTMAYRQSNRCNLCLIHWRKTEPDKGSENWASYILSRRQKVRKPIYFK